MDKTNKKTDMTAFRLTEDFRIAAKDLKGTHKAKSMTDYFRGLIYLDALLAGYGTDSLDKPSWVTKDYGGLIKEFRHAPVQKIPGTETPEFQSFLKRLVSEDPSDREFQLKVKRAMTEQKGGRKVG